MKMKMQNELWTQMDRHKCETNKKKKYDKALCNKRIQFKVTIATIKHCTVYNTNKKKKPMEISQSEMVKRKNHQPPRKYENIV